MRGFLDTLARGGARGLTEAQAIEAAFYLIADRNPLPAVCGRLCPHHCETGCTREPYDGGVSVNQVERAVAEAAIHAAWPLRRLDGDGRGTAVTVVGAGAAGLSAAYQLARRGYAVTARRPARRARRRTALRHRGRAAAPGGARRRDRPDPGARRDLRGPRRPGGRGSRSPPRGEDEGLRAGHARRDRRDCGGGAFRAACGAHCSTPRFGRRSGGRRRRSVRRSTRARCRSITICTSRAARTTGETWPAAGAIAEAQRCLSCGACFECDSCYKYCPDQAVLRPLAPGEPYRFKLEFCQGCNKCAEQCPSNYIEMR